MKNCKFYIGQIVHHSLFGYRGVIVDIDPCFMYSEQWYDEVAKTRPPKDRPWVKLLVHNTDIETYVAQQHLAPSEDQEQISHPELMHYFSAFENGRYLSNHIIH